MASVTFSIVCFGLRPPHLRRRPASIVLAYLGLWGWRRRAGFAVRARTVLPCFWSAAPSAPLGRVSLRGGVGGPRPPMAAVRVFGRRLFFDAGHMVIHSASGFVYRRLLPLPIVLPWLLWHSSLARVCCSRVFFWLGGWRRRAGFAVRARTVLPCFWFAAPAASLGRFRSAVALGGLGPPWPRWGF